VINKNNAASRRQEMAMSMIKSLCCGLLLSASALAIPDTLSYVAAVEEDGAAFNGTVSATFALFETASGGSALWDETQTSAVVLQGQLVAELGASAADPLDDRILQRDSLFLQVTIDGETLEPRLPIRAVPFARVAQRALDADAVGGLTAADIATTADIDALGAAVRSEAVPFTRLSGVPAVLSDGAISFGEVVGIGPVLADGIVDFNELVNVPAGLADGDQVGPTFTAGGGINISAVNVIAVAGINSAMISDGVVSSVDVAPNTLTAEDIATNAIAADEIAADAVSSSEVATDAIGSAEISSGAVGTDELGTNAVTTAKIAGTEVDVYGRAGGCVRDGYISLAAGGTCPMRTGIQALCLSPLVLTCRGDCENVQGVQPATCPNVVIGKLIAP
jgi:hypothetical protein